MENIDNKIKGSKFSTCKNRKIVTKWKYSVLQQRNVAERNSGKSAENSHSNTHLWGGLPWQHTQSTELAKPLSQTAYYAWASAHRGKWGQLTPRENGWKIKKRKHVKKTAIRSDRCRERRSADHIFIQIYFRMHHFVVKLSKFHLRWQGGIDPPSPNPADTLITMSHEYGNFMFLVCVHNLKSLYK